MFSSLTNGHASSKTAWVLASLLCLPAAVTGLALPPSNDFIVHSMSVNHVLGGAIQETSHLHVIQKRELRNELLLPEPSALQEAKYYIALTSDEAAALAHSEVFLQAGNGQSATYKDAGQLLPEGLVSVPHEAGLSAVGPLQLYSIRIPHDLLAAEGVISRNVTVAMHLVFHKLSEPLPKAATQSELATFISQVDSAPLAVYGAGEVLTTVKCPTPKVLVHIDDDELPQIAQAITQAGDTLSIGPQSNIPPLPSSIHGKAARIRVRYQIDKPVLTFVDLDRHVEVSHWGDNLSFRDRIWMRNDGPALKGHFSRLQLRQQDQFGLLTNNVIRLVQMPLPPGSRDVYFIDDVGNVSTSEFRPSRPDPATVPIPPYKLPDGKASLLSLTPRYPLLGGWNYTFTVGYDVPLSRGGWGRLVSPGSYSLAVPFWNALPGVPVGKVKTRIVLPEGAKLVRVKLPFEAERCFTGSKAISCVNDGPAPTLRDGMSSSYMDTSGRPTLVVVKHKVGVNDAGIIYIAYTLDARAYFRKPFAVASAVLAVFSVAGLIRRLKG